MNLGKNNLDTICNICYKFIGLSLPSSCHKEWLDALKMVTKLDTPANNLERLGFKIGVQLKSNPTYLDRSRGWIPIAKPHQVVFKGLETFVFVVGLTDHKSKYKVTEQRSGYSLGPSSLDIYETCYLVAEFIREKGITSTLMEKKILEAQNARLR